MVVFSDSGGEEEEEEEVEAETSLAAGDRPEIGDELGEGGWRKMGGMTEWEKGGGEDEEEERGCGSGGGGGEEEGVADRVEKQGRGRWSWGLVVGEWGMEMGGEDVLSRDEDAIGRNVELEDGRREV